MVEGLAELCFTKNTRSRVIKETIRVLVVERGDSTCSWSSQPRLGGPRELRQSPILLCMVINLLDPRFLIKFFRTVKRDILPSTPDESY